MNAVDYLDAHEPGWAEREGPGMADALRRVFAQWTADDLRLLKEPRVQELMRNAIRLAAEKRALQIEVERLRSEG